MRRFGGVGRFGSEEVWKCEEVREFGGLEVRE